MRGSHAAEYFFQHLRDTPPADILDLGMLSQETTTQLGALGHRLNFTSLMVDYDKERPKLAGKDGQVSRRAADRFFRQHLDYPAHSFQAALAWDVLQHLDKHAMQSAITRLRQLLKPDSAMLCLFQDPREDGTVSIFNGAVCSHASLRLQEVERRLPRQVLQPGDLELEFPRFRSIDLFLKRGRLLEVLVMG